MQMPDLVSLGGQKAFPAFMKQMTPDDSETVALPDVAQYKRMIAQVIIFKSADRLIKPRFPAFKANVTAYTVALVSHLLGDRIGLDAIWERQSISPQLGKQILVWADEVHALLQDSAKGRMISEWAKRKDCWEVMLDHVWSVPDMSIPELIPVRKAA
jgi:hypothetical protein